MEMVRGLCRATHLGYRKTPFSVMHMKGEETPVSIFLALEPGSEFSSLGITELVCYLIW